MDDEENGSTFREDELSLVTWQQGVKHHNPHDFKIGEKVFLNSNPEVELIVDSFTSEKVICVVVTTDDEISFFPECITKYKYAAILQSGRFKININ